jgi:hypothetical protein
MPTEQSLARPARPKIHVINDLPHIYELDDMLDFCARHERLYICGASEDQEYLLKYLDACGARVEGYAATDPSDQRLGCWRRLPVAAVGDVIGQPGAGLILALPDRHYRSFIPKFRKAGFADYFTMTEYNKRTIAAQMRPRPIGEMTFEVSLADHCNLSCQMCDHYSQLSGERFADAGALERDLRQMGRLFGNKIACVSLLGGEPTLHPELIRCLRAVRGEFPDAELILLTNGIRLLPLENSPQGNLWVACRELGAHITVTVYPLNIDYAAMERKAAEYGVQLAMSSNIHAGELTKIVKVSDKHTFDLNGEAGRRTFVSCLYFNKFNVLKDGRYYMCPVQANIGIFNKAFGQSLELACADSVDIYGARGWQELAEFAAKPAPFCRYCDLRNWGPHSEWKASTKSIDEYI